ncbi:hypothetical protein ACHAPT_012701 [Fusarium lateritium]
MLVYFGYSYYSDDEDEADESEGDDEEDYSIHSALTVHCLILRRVCNLREGSREDNIDGVFERVGLLHLYGHRRMRMRIRRWDTQTLKPV